MRRAHQLALGALLFLVGCGMGNEEQAAADSATVAARLARLDSALADKTGPTDVPIARWFLPIDLTEISGLVLAPEGDRILAHSDEDASIVVMDFRTGVVRSRFHVGERAVVGDFEGITRVGTTYYMMTSKGQIYSFAEGKDGEGVPYTVIDTKLATECEFEGIAHDPAINALLLPCKFPKKSMRDSLVIYRWPLGADPASVSKLTVPLATVIAGNDWEEVSPSDIAVDPFTGNYVITTAREVALIVLTPAGEVVSSGLLPTEIPHVEGIGITRDGILILGAEAGDAPQTITLFRWGTARQGVAPDSAAADTARATVPDTTVTPTR